MRNKKIVIFITIAILFVVIISIIAILFIINNRKNVQKEDDNKQSDNTVEDGNLKHSENAIWVEKIESDYKIATGNKSGNFVTGQDADIMLSGIDFNNTGGGLLFNHPKGLASDGTHLILADTQNNRVLIWNSFPTSNSMPDVVLGQDDFNTNEPGKAMNKLNWPVSVATDGKQVFVADTYNDRILIWNNFPSQNGESADLVLENTSKGSIDEPGLIGWPWAVWTDGKKLIVASTSAKQVLIWNEIPTSNNQKADMFLKSKDFGTPRTIGCDGIHLSIGDHNAFGDNAGNFFWKSFPQSSSQEYDFFISDPATIDGDLKQKPMGYHMNSIFTPSDEFLMISNSYLAYWKSFPESDKDTPDAVIGKHFSEEGYDIQDGDGSSMAIAGGRLYLSLSNSNKIVVYNDIPKISSQKPDFAIGSSSIDINTLEENYFITNPVPATDGKSLFVSSDFDRKLYIWKNLPDESGAKPDYIYHNVGGWDNALYGDKFVLGGNKEIYIWENLPLEENLPDIIIQDKIGSINFQDIKGVALDNKYLYLADNQANKLYIWEGILSEENSSPKFTIDIQSPWRLSSDGQYLAVTVIYDHSIKIYKISDLSNSSKPISTVGGPGKFNLPQSGEISNGYLFVADTSFNRLLVWDDLQDAFSGKDAGIILGEEDTIDRQPEIFRNKTFWPATTAFDGTYLWLGEFKFSTRLLRFSLSE